MMLSSSIVSRKIHMLKKAKTKNEKAIAQWFVYSVEAVLAGASYPKYRKPPGSGDQVSFSWASPLLLVEE